MYSVSSASITETGKVREINEDAVLETGSLFAVADGMGGHQAGEVASTLALSAIGQYVEDNLGAIPGEKLVEKAVSGANAVVHQKAVSSARFRDMGTTVTVLYREGDTAYIGHVGDSRAYLLRNGDLRQLTDDHSLVAKLVQEGEITPREARSHPQRNVILKALGLESQLEADVVSVKIQPGDVFLLATDGLTSLVGDDVISRVLAAFPGPVDAAGRLVELALEAGGIDNVSVVIVSFAESPTVVPVGGATGGSNGGDNRGDKGGGPRASRGKAARIWLILLVVLLVLALAGFGVGLYFFNHTYFVGVKGGKVTLFKGFPFWDMAMVETQTDIEIRFLPDSLRTRVEENLVTESRRNAEKTIESLALEVEKNSSIVPDVEGKAYDEATEMLLEAGLHPVAELVSRPGFEPDVVSTQDPAPGARVGKGSDVMLK
ncbi:MAG: Stp1/IreP family PP2C-type Ser/Thr phosphatase [Actinobacteria bacterium]|nr:Stp1/IreP family PP2C-type Ser/Thr phosphatase [Actinomycetota bacterium]MCG2819591.1 Stp1/IreP family PP2C-type Ser/Thr phosphatase [Actinomycetes bacterium]MBU4219459.1 Stp1/IreP family PP2C-type Ser/Thr phosphatase [Actinomycetota bacterium]MBU4360003.1 Stp1/IreP family PP2C-type Ser/Thr phosphatase [Actinomycetota bacterium]MBU4391463.1 Stp1/IreP family PP2C-type Ser/Thr phosphatase [Actinomycetota bacterium]